MATRLISEIGTVVLGNRAFRDGTISGKYLPYGSTLAAQFVVTHDEREPVELGGLTSTFVTGGIEWVITMARDAAGEKRMALLGASIDQQALAAGLVDEIVIHLAPVILDDGIKLFEHIGREIELRSEELVVAGQVASLCFGVDRNPV